MNKVLSLAISLSLILGVLIFTGVQPVQAASFTVNSTGDGVDATVGDGICQTSTAGECTLRAAIMEANALAGDDVINLPAAPISLTLTGAAEDASLLGDLDITSNISINGASASTTLIDGNALNERVLQILSGNVSVSNVTIRNGDESAANGGGVLVSGGSLTLNYSQVNDNTAVNGGGLAVNGGSLTLNFTSVGRAGFNSAATNGGGIFLLSGTTAVINNSLLAENNARAGGGIYVPGGATATFNNSTLSTNNASGSTVTDGGGGAFVAGTATFNSATIAMNLAATSAGGGLLQLGGTINLRNTIVADNTGPVSSPDCSGTMVSLGYNLLERSAGCGGIVNNVNGDIVVSSITPPTTFFSVSGLADNGGPTFTHAIDLTVQSILAVDRGNPSGCSDGGSTFSNDQRGPGFIRNQNFRCDIGAFEYIYVSGNPATLTPTFTFTPSNTPIPTFTFTPAPTSSPAPTNTFTATFTNTPTITPTGSRTASATPAPKLPLFTSLPPTVDIGTTLTAAVQLQQTQAAQAAISAIPTITPDVAQTATTFALTNAAPTATAMASLTPTPGPTIAFPSETGVLAVSESVGRAGGNFVCGLFMVEADPGVVPEGSQFHCNTVSSDDPAVPGLPSGVNGLWQTADIKIVGSNGVPIESFTQPLKICAYYSAGYLATVSGEATRFTIYTASAGGEWRRLPTAPDGTTQRVCADIDRFSLFRLAGQPAATEGVAGGILGWLSGGIVGMATIACGLILLVVVIVVVIAIMRGRKPKEATA